MSTELQQVIIGTAGHIDHGKTALIKAMVGNESFVAKVEELKEGTDIYVGSHKTATDVLSRLKLAYTQANKLAGKKRGKNLYRRSYCVRL